MTRMQLHRQHALPMRCSSRSAAPPCAWRLRQPRRIAAAVAPPRLADVDRFGATSPVLTQTAPTLPRRYAGPAKSP
jgi:hypothetical protein